MDRTRRPGPLALRSCLEHLQVSTVTEAQHVIVEVSWVDGSDAFCVVYRPPYDPTRRVGLRRILAPAMKAVSTAKPSRDGLRVVARRCLHP